VYAAATYLKAIKTNYHRRCTLEKTCPFFASAAAVGLQHAARCRETEKRTSDYVNSVRFLTQLNDYILPPNQSVSFLPPPPTIANMQRAPVEQEKTSVVHF
jgi:hypothetical protein